MGDLIQTQQQVETQREIWRLKKQKEELELQVTRWEGRVQELERRIAEIRRIIG